MIFTRVRASFNSDVCEVALVDVPSECPYCHFTITPHLRAAYFVYNYTGENLEVICRCSNTKCYHTFVAEYYDRSGQLTYNLKGVLKPAFSKLVEFPVLLTAISPSFVEIFNQAKIAEEVMLDKIAGMGYRKALEFLVKDYLTHNEPNKEEEIKKKMLGPCIQLINDSRIKDLAERATWLGNDETHYVRRWVDKDINDLKILIRLVVHYVDADLLYHDMLQTMPKS